ncbi:hypothetical protein ACV34H_34605, partial [Pseudomonas aeruginosa]
HIHHALYLAGSGHVLARRKQMLLHVNLDAPRSVPFTGQALVGVDARPAAHRPLPVPERPRRLICLPAVRSAPSLRSISCLRR